MVTQVESARAFARSLNILLKYARLYGLAHQRTSSQLHTAWGELARAAGTETGLMLGVADCTLLLDGAPLEGQAERSFAALLTAAGIASIHFSAGLKREEFDKWVGAFASGKPSELVQNIKAAVGENSAIRVNEVRFIADGGDNVAQQLVARTIGAEVSSWIQNPEKLLQLIAAAMGAKSGHNAGTASASADGGSGAAGSGTGTGSGPGSNEGQAEFVDEESVTGALRLLASLGSLEPGEQRNELALQELTQRMGSAKLLQNVLASLPSDEGKSDNSTLMRVAERLAIRFALQQFERGDVRVNAVQELMQRMGREIDSLRKVLNAHEDKMTRAGLMVEGYADVLDRQFWAAMPERGKNGVLLSSDAWCIPARNIRAYVEQLLTRGDSELAGRILSNCTAQLENDDRQARSKMAAAMSQLADLYGRLGGNLLTEALTAVGLRICCEESLDMQTLLGAAYVRLTQEAGQRQNYAALTQSVQTLEQLQEYRPRTAQEVRPRVAVEGRLHIFIAHAVRQPRIPLELVDLLRRVPTAAAQELTNQFSACTRRTECERYVELATAMGSGLEECLVGMLRSTNSGEAARSSGLLSRIRPEILAQELPQRVQNFNRSQQDATVRQLAAAGSPQRGLLLQQLLPLLDPLVAPEALDEIGFAGDASASGILLQLAAGQGLAAEHPYMRVKAIEALGRLRNVDAVALLRQIIGDRQFFTAARDRELKLSAAQALITIDPVQASALPNREFSPRELGMGALPAGETDWVRQRRYPRIQPAKGLRAVAITSKGKFEIDIERISLGGGLLASDRRLPRAGEVWLEWQAGLHRVRTQAIIRDTPTKEVGFEVLDIALDSRSRLRKMIVEHAPAA